MLSLHSSFVLQTKAEHIHHTRTKTAQRQRLRLAVLTGQAEL